MNNHKIIRRYLFKKVKRKINKDKVYLKNQCLNKDQDHDLDKRKKKAEK